MQHTQDWPRAAGTKSAFDVVKSGFRPPRPAQAAADLDAVNQGDGRLVACMFRGSYGHYPPRFKARVLCLTLSSIQVRPAWYSLYRATITVDEPVLEVRQRARNLRTDWNLKASAHYAEGHALAFAGTVVIACQTPLGTIEFGVPRPDAPLLLHVLKTMASKISETDSAQPN